MVTDAAAEPPQALLDQLKPGGRMVLPLGCDDVQQLAVVTKKPAGELDTEAIMPVRFTRLETTS